MLTDTGELRGLILRNTIIQIPSVKTAEAKVSK